MYDHHCSSQAYPTGTPLVHSPDLTRGRSRQTSRHLDSLHIRRAVGEGRARRLLQFPGGRQEKPVLGYIPIEATPPRTG